jgi:hypothetical protein
MEKLKPIEHFGEPDKRNERAAGITEDGFQPITYEDYYNQIAGLRSISGVPDPISSYIEMVKNVYIHGWYYYPLFTISGYLSIFAIEMGLRVIYKEEDPEQKIPFKALLSKSVDAGLIKAGNFSVVKEKWELSKYVEEETGGLIKAFPQTNEYCKTLVRALPTLRNAFSHPKFPILLPPGQAFSMIKISIEFINQLFEN